MMKVCFRVWHVQFFGTHFFFCYKSTDVLICHFLFRFNPCMCFSGYHFPDELCCYIYICLFLIEWMFSRRWIHRCAGCNYFNWDHPSCWLDPRPSRLGGSSPVRSHFQRGSPPVQISSRGAGPRRSDGTVYLSCLIQAQNHGCDSHGATMKGETYCTWSEVLSF